MLEPIFTPEQLKMLETPLRPDEIEHKQGLSYMKGQFAVVKANRIFGVGNWAYKQLGPIEITESATTNTKNNSIYLVSAMVELTVRGCETFVEQGDCEAQGMGASSLSMARKGAVTDGLKRCLKNFGPAFGLDLYFTTSPVPAATRPANAPTQPQQNRTAPAPAPSQAQPPRPVTPANTSIPNGVATLAKPSITIIGDSKSSCPKCAAPMELLKVVEETGDTFQGERCVEKSCGFRRKVATN